jgi:hypothetical protein
LLNDLDAVGAPILGAVLVPSHSWWRRIFGGARHGQGKPPSAADRTEPVAAPRAAESEPSSGHVQLTP